ncbi:MAG: (2R)-3-sulfolactate dehydrogenase (NADP+) [Parasphingorhabdus sp.]|jgi:(2R)-3-sulfolactate dehydrogenase (NADP+)
MTTVQLTIDSAIDLAVSVLIHANTANDAALSVAKALVNAEVDGQRGHGLSRLTSYAAQARSGKVNGQAIASVDSRKSAAVRINAQSGFAFPAFDLARSEIASLAPICGIACAAIYNSHHFGQAGYHVEQLARQGLVAMVFGNSPKAIAPWGGNAALFGTNPVAFAAPRQFAAPLVIDLSLSKVARGKIMVAVQKGQPIEEGWALDAAGQPTTSAEDALQGTMLPMGDAKGAALVMMVEILAAALTGANYGFEASSFFDAEGNPPGVGQMMMGLDPEFFSAGSFPQRLELLVNSVIAQPGTRLPGDSRLQARKLAESNGIQISTDLHRQLCVLIES